MTSWLEEFQWITQEPEQIIRLWESRVIDAKERGIRRKPVSGDPSSASPMRISRVPGRVLLMAE